MLQPRQQFGFALEIFNRFGARLGVSEHLNHFFDRHNAICQIAICRFVNRSHSAPAHALHNFVAVS